MDNAQDWNWRVVSQVLEQVLERHSKSRRQIQQLTCSSGLFPQPGSLHYCVRGFIQGVPTSCSFELVCAQCWVSAGTSGNVEDMEIIDGDKGPARSTGKTKIMLFGIYLGLLKTSRKDLCRVCQKRVGINTMFCGGCTCYKHNKNSSTKSCLRHDPNFRCSRCLGTARHGLLMKIKQWRRWRVLLKLETVPVLLSGVHDLCWWWLRAGDCNSVQMCCQLLTLLTNGSMCVFNMRKACDAASSRD